MKKLFILIAAVITLTSFKPDKPAYRLYSAEGKEVKYSKMLETLQEGEVVFFGELHNNPIAHWLQYEVTQDLYNNYGDKLMLGAEMFEADNQLLLDEYLDGKISRKSFEKEARLWDNYSTDYKPLVEFAKDSNLAFIATNVPRRYASVVYKQGIDTLAYLSPEARRYMAPLPIPYDSTVKCYADMMTQMMAMGHANPNLPKSQALKDATMAYRIYVARQPDEVFLHYNGSYHSNNGEGIIWYLNQYDEGLRIVTIAVVEQKDIDSLLDENKSIADFVVVVPETMTKTY